MLGPIDYIAVGFRGNNFDGSIVSELATAADAGIIRVVDLLFIRKDENGVVEAGEFRDQPDELQQAFAGLQISDEPLFTEDDIDKIAEYMDVDTAAGVLVLEHVWAKGLKQALQDAGGVLIAEGRVRADTAEAAELELESVR